MNIDSIKRGIVIDHIHAGRSMDIYKYLHLDELECSVAIIKNVKSSLMGRKDIIKIDDNIDVDLDVLGKRLGVELGAEEDCDTLGGLVFSRLAEIPSDGERPVVECLGVRVSVEQILDRRVAWAVVEKLPEAEDSAETARTALAKQIQTK